MKHEPVKGYTGLTSEPDQPQQGAWVNYSCTCGDDNCTWVGWTKLERYSPPQAKKD